MLDLRSPSDLPARVAQTPAGSRDRRAQPIGSNGRTERIRPYRPIPFLILILLLAFAGAPSASPTPQPTVSSAFDQLVEHLRPSLVEVIAYRPMGPALRSVPGERRLERIEPFRGTVWATGVVVDDWGRILTCAEAAQPGDSLQVRGSDGRISGARFLAQDVANGVSLIEVSDQQGLRALPPLASSAARSGIRLMVLHHDPNEPVADLSLGLLDSDPGEPQSQSELLVTLPDCRGTCGGVVVDCEGNFRGMVVDVRAIRESDVGCTRIHQAVDRLGCSQVRVLPPRALQELSADLMEKSHRPVGFLGVRAEIVGPDDGGDPKPGTASDNLAVVRVLPGSPAEVAGILPGDQLLEIDGRPVREVSEVTERIASMPPGTEVQVKVLRQGVPMTVRAELGDRSSLDWMEREDQLNLAREKELRQCIRELQGRLNQLEEQRARLR